MDIKEAVQNFKKEQAAYKKAETVRKAKEKRLKEAKAELMRALHELGTTLGVAPAIEPGDKYRYAVVEGIERKVSDPMKMAQKLASLGMYEAFSIKTTPILEALESGTIDGADAKAVRRMLIETPIEKLSVTKAKN